MCPGAYDQGKASEKILGWNLGSGFQTLIGWYFSKKNTTFPLLWLFYIGGKGLEDGLGRRMPNPMATLYCAELFILRGFGLRSLLPISAQDRNLSLSPYPYPSPAM